MQRAAARRTRSGAASRDEDWDEEGEDGEESLGALQHKAMLSEVLDIAADPLFDTSEVGIAPVLWGTRPERSVHEVFGRFAKAAEQEYKKVGREYAEQSAALMKQATAKLLQSTTDAEKIKQLEAQQGQIDLWLEAQIAETDATIEKEVAARFKQLAADADALRDHEYTMAVRKGGSGLPHVAAEEAALAQVASFAEGTAGEAYMRRMLPVLQGNSSISYADKQRALGIMLYRVAR